MTSQDPQNNTEPTFESLGLAKKVLRVIQDVGYETPSAIQSAAIPPLIEGRDILGAGTNWVGKNRRFRTSTFEQHRCEESCNPDFGAYANSRVSNSSC